MDQQTGDPDQASPDSTFNSVRERKSRYAFGRESGLPATLRSWVGRALGACRKKRISLCKLCDSLCLCGGIVRGSAHHRDTEIAQRTTETNSSTWCPVS